MAFTLATKTKASSNSRGRAASDEDEFAGLWINVGVETKTTSEDGDEAVKFNRLPRGIAIGDLVEHKVYANTHERNPDWAQEATIVNALIGKIREAASQLEEGESMPVDFSVQLYKRQEQVESVAGATEVDVDLDSLFGR